MQKYIDAANNWLTEKGPEFIANVIAALVLLIVGKIIISIALTIVSKSLERSNKLKPLLKTFLIGTARNVLWLVLWVVALGTLGVEVGPIVASLGVVGFVLGFAFQNTLSNFAAGLMILANNPFEAGDFVEADGHLGAVSELNLMATTLKTPDNKRITLPNSRVWGAPIINYTVLGTRRVELNLSISYGADITKAKQIAMDIVKADSRVLADPAPLVEVLNYGDSSVNLVIRPWAKVSDFWGVYFSLNQLIKEAFDKNSIEIPFPQMVLHQAPPPKQ